MDATTELRWWWPGTPPDEVVAWFTGLPGSVTDEQRTDRYLVPVTGRDSGVKARAEERFEVKTLVDREPGVVVTAGVVGTLERWNKWSFPLSGTGQDRTPRVERGTWVETHKHRWTLRVDGCDLELVSIDVEGQRSWSLAAEADGIDDAGRDRVLAALRWLAATDPPDQLEADDARSHGYGEHLRGLVAAEHVPG